MNENMENMDKITENAERTLYRSKALLIWMVMGYSVGVVMLTSTIKDLPNSDLTITIPLIICSVLLMIVGIICGVIQGKAIHLATEILHMVKVGELMSEAEKKSEGEKYGAYGRSKKRI